MELFNTFLYDEVEMPLQIGISLYHERIYEVESIGYMVLGQRHVYVNLYIYFNSGVVKCLRRLVETLNLTVSSKLKKIYIVAMNTCILITTLNYF